MLLEIAEVYFLLLTGDLYHLRNSPLQSQLVLVVGSCVPIEWVDVAGDDESLGLQVDASAFVLDVHGIAIEHL